MLEHLISSLCEKLNRPFDKEKNQEDFYTLTLNDELTFELKEQYPGFYIKSDIGEMPDGSHEDLLIHFMKANYLGQGTGGSTLALSPDTKRLMLVLNIGEDTNAREFSDHIETFANYLDYWKAYLEKYKNTKR